MQKGLSISRLPHHYRVGCSKAQRQAAMLQREYSIELRVTVNHLVLADNQMLNHALNVQLDQYVSTNVDEFED
jgi:hypothetical protein